jgi:hypothetical protein
MGMADEDPNQAKRHASERAGRGVGSFDPKANRRSHIRIPRRSRTWLALMAAVAIGLFASPAGAFTDRFVLARFDIDGVRLYMSAAEALRALRAKFGPSARIDIAYDDDRLHPGQKYVSGLTYHGANYGIAVRFVEWTDPGEPGWSSVPQTETARFVAMWLIEATDADRENFRDEVLAKYPRPDRGNDFDKTWEPPSVQLWCTGALYDYQHICEKNDPVMIMGTYRFEQSIFDQGPGSYSIQISDNAPGLRVQLALQALERAQQRVTHGRPPL